jgi:hypothetical protein
MKKITALLTICIMSLAFIVITGCGEEEGGAPQNFAIEAANNGELVKLTWEEPTEGAPDEYVIYFEEINTTGFVAETTLEATDLSFTHDPKGLTGKYYVAAAYGGDEYDTGELSTVPISTSSKSLGELNASEKAGYGWDITTDYKGYTYSMIESASIPLVDFYLSNWAVGITTLPYGIWAPDQVATDPGNQGGVPTGSWKTTAIGKDLISDPQVILPEHTTTNYVQYVDMTSFPAYVAIYTTDGYYALVHVPTQPDTLNGTVDVEAWFQSVQGLRLIAH